MKNINYKIFVVEDDKFYAQIVQTYLENQGFIDTKVFTSGKECIDNLDLKPDLILLDYVLGFDNGLEILKRIKEQNIQTQVVMLSAQDHLDVAVKSYKYGAFDYIEKDRNALQNISKIIAKLNAVNSPTSNLKNNIKNGFNLFF